MGTVDLHELKIYQLAMRVGEDVWALTVGWDTMSKQTIGVQWVRSADSIASNISEGHGRGSVEENARFCCNALGSLSQTHTWLEKAASRRLILDSVARELSMKLDALSGQLDNYIHSLELKQASAVRETSRDGSIHLLPLEEFFHPRPPAWNT
jgi:four helix bundle protein